MKVNVQLLALSLFWWVPVYLDLDTGLTYNVATQTAEIEKLKNRRRLPLYSEAPIYQRYLELARDKAGIDFGDFFNRYPHFEFIPDQKPEHAKEFFKKHTFCAILSMRLPSRISMNICISSNWSSRKTGVKKRDMNGMKTELF